MADKKISIIFEAIDKATAEITKIGGSLSSFAKKNQDTFKKMGVAGGIATTAIVGLGNSLVNSAKDMEPVRNSFERLSKDIGQNSNDILSSLKKASKGTINDYDLMLSANKAMSLGVASNTEEFTTLMDIARVKGQAMGLTMEQAFSDIVTGLGRSSPMILDNLGITIKLGEAQEQYAKILGKSVQEMTDVEKKQALINAVVSQGKEELASAGEVAITSAERFAAMSATFKNIGYNLGEAFLPVLEDIISAITPIIEKFSNRISENRELAKNLIIAAGIISGLVAVIGTLGLALPSIIAGIGALGTAFTIATGPVGLFTGAVAGISWGLYKLFTDFPTYEQQIESLEKQMGLLSKEYEQGLITVEEYEQGMEAIEKEMIELERKSNTLWGSIRNDFASTIDSIKKTPEYFSLMLDAMVVLIMDIEKRFGTFIEDARQWGNNLIDMIVVGIKEKYDAVKEAVLGTANIIKNFLGFGSPTKEGPGSDSDKWIPNLINMIVDGFSDGENEIKTSVERIASVMNKGISKGADFDNLKQQISSFQVSAIQVFNNLSSKIQKQKTDIKGLVDEYRDLEKQIKNINLKISGIQSEGRASVAERAVRIEKERAEIQNQMESTEKELSESEKAELQTKLDILNAEYQIAIANASQAEIAEARRQSTLSETEKIIEQTQERIRQAEIERKNILVQMEMKKTQIEEELKLYLELDKEKKAVDKAYFDLFGERMEKAQKSVRDTISMLQDMISLQRQAERGASSSSGERALGGTVLAGKSYLVGERGPEMFTPATTGSITPSNQVGGNGVSININMGGVVVQNDADENRLVEKISNALKREAQLFSLGIN